jgi:ABC-type amino acid transport system permease subunit
MPAKEFVTAALCLGFFTSARVAEQVRAGIGSLPRGQRDAALALGLTLGQAYRHVILPQALRIVIPPLTSEFMNVFKNSSIAFAIGVMELTFQARQMQEDSEQGIETYLAVTLLYFICAFTANRGMADRGPHAGAGPGMCLGSSSEASRIIRSGFARVVCGLSPLRRGIISSPP